MLLRPLARRIARPLPRLVARVFFLVFAPLAVAAGCSDDDFGSTRPSQDAAAPGQDDFASNADMAVPHDMPPTDFTSSGGDDALDGGTSD